jgi:glycosyltransferase involved in cell wall biosynthesis
LVAGENGERPFVSIGITTYNRHDLLREALESILAQTFVDFEVIVGNDYTEEVLTGEILGISDSRVRFVNHPVNLREVGNMNALLGMARGRYFTWLFDDDLYEPDFLETAHDCLVKAGFPPAFYPSFRMLPSREKFQPRKITGVNLVEFTGREFLRGYSPRQPRIVSTYGLFETAVLRDVVGGVEELCTSTIGVYCEYLFMVRCALLDRIVFMDAPFVLIRIHPDSWSESSSELDKYLAAGKELVRRSAEVLRHPILTADFDANLLTICEQHLITVAHRFAKVEVVRKEFGIHALWRAINRYRQERVQIRKVFRDQGSRDGFRTMLAFAKIDLIGYYTVVMNLASGFYRRNEACCGPARNPEPVSNGR